MLINFAGNWVISWQRMRSSMVSHQQAGDQEEAMCVIPNLSSRPWESGELMVYVTVEKIAV